MAVRLKASIGAMALIPVMMMLHCSFLPLEPPGPAHPNLVISASCGGGFIMNSRTVTIYGSGKVFYDTMFGNISNAGHKEAEISQESIEGLINTFKENDFFSFNDDYSGGGEMYARLTYKDTPVIKSVSGDPWSPHIRCSMNLNTNSVRCETIFVNPAGWDTLWNECWKIKEELFP
jgi:hypothetical protein